MPPVDDFDAVVIAHAHDVPDPGCAVIDTAQMLGFLHTPATGFLVFCTYSAQTTSSYLPSPCCNSRSLRIYPVYSRINSAALPAISSEVACGYSSPHSHIASDIASAPSTDLAFSSSRFILLPFCFSHFLLQLYPLFSCTKYLGCTPPGRAHCGIGSVARPDLCASWGRNRTACRSGCADVFACAIMKPCYWRGSGHGQTAHYCWAVPVDLWRAARNGRELFSLGPLFAGYVITS